MSNENSRQLLALLAELAETELDDDTEEEVQGDVQALLRRLVDPSIAERIEYVRYELERFRTVPTVQGLALVSAEVLLSQIFVGLQTADEAELASLGAPLGLTPTQMRSAIYTIYWILSALQWETRDRNVPSVLPREQCERILATNISSLKHFRLTGEP